MNIIRSHLNGDKSTLYYSYYILMGAEFECVGLQGRKVEPIVMRELKVFSLNPK